MDIEIDRKHVARRQENTWHLFRKDANGNYMILEAWRGNRRSLFHKLEQYGIVASRDAEQALLSVPEQPAFREDEQKRKAS